MTVSARHQFTRDDNLYEHFTVGETIVHPRGRTVSDEHMMWTNFVLNTAQLHFNQKMCDDHPEVTFNGRRVVYGGIVFAFDARLLAMPPSVKTSLGPDAGRFAKRLKTPCRCRTRFSSRTETS